MLLLPMRHANTLMLESWHSMLFQRRKITLLLTNAFGCTLVLSCSFCCLSHIVVVVVDSLGWSLARRYHCLSLSVVLVSHISLSHVIVYHCLSLSVVTLSLSACRAFVSRIVINSCTSCRLVARLFTHIIFTHIILCARCAVVP
jgi:hypothetical protein